MFRTSYMSVVDSVATKNAKTDDGPEGHPDAMDRAAWVARAAESVNISESAGVAIGAGGATPRSPSYSDATGAAPPPAPSAERHGLWTTVLQRHVTQGYVGAFFCRFSDQPLPPCCVLITVPDHEHPRASGRCGGSQRRWWTTMRSGRIPTLQGVFWCSGCLHGTPFEPPLTLYCTLYC